jgi:hypothetical protein
MSDMGENENRPIDQVPEGERYTPAMVTHLKNTRPWVMFMGILRIISCVMFGVGAMYMFGLGACVGTRFFPAGMFSGMGSRGALAGPIFIVLGVFYLVLAVLCIPLSIYLLRYAGSIKNLVSTGRTGNLEEALLNQQKFWKYSGILTIVVLALAAVLITVVFIVAVAGAMRVY